MAAVKKQRADEQIESLDRELVKERTFQLKPLRVSHVLSFILSTPFLVMLLIIGAFLLGSMYTKIQDLQTTATSLAALPTQQQPNAQPQVTTAPPQKVEVDAGHLPIKGDPNAKVTIIEFADLRCPYCKQFYSDSVKQLLTDYVNTGKAKFAFRHYAFLGPASTVAANASECANEQGKFWEMYDYLYTNQPAETDTTLFTVDNLTPIAGTLGMNTDQFRTCLSTNKYDKNVSDDFTAGQKAGVSGTPTIFINGMPLVGAQPYAQVKAAIDAALNQ